MFMHRRIVSMLLVMGMCITLMPLTAFAAEEHSDGCYIASAICPSEYTEFAMENVSDYVLSFGNELSATNIFVGTPFSFADGNSDVFYFPVICDGHIRYLFRIYPDGNSFSGVISSFLADDIDSLAPLTSVESPMYLSLAGSKIIATIGPESYELFEYPSYLAAEDEAVTLTEESYEAKDIKEPLGINLDLRQTRDVFERIELDITETQQDEYWCTAFCLATIIRTRTNYETTAYTLATMQLGSNPDINTTFPWSGIYLAERYGLYPTVLRSLASNDTLVSQINSGRPCIMAVESSKYAHSLVLRGWGSTGIWSVWNPWFTYYENFSITGTYLPTGYKPTSENLYTPYMSAYNF